MRVLWVPDLMSGMFLQIMAFAKQIAGLDAPLLTRHRRGDAARINWSLASVPVDEKNRGLELQRNAGTTGGVLIVETADPPHTVYLSKRYFYFSLYLILFISTS
jgi:hypothetical protein